MGQQGPLGAKKKTLFSKMILDHMECQNNYFWRVLSLWWPLGPPKIPKCLENGLFWHKDFVKNGSKMCFSKKMILDHLGCLNK